MLPKIFKLSHGWATKYYWLGILKSDLTEISFEQNIKDSKLTFCKYSGTTSADIHGSTLALNFYSETIVSIFEEQGDSLFNRCKIKYDESLHLAENLFYLDVIKIIPRIQNEDVFSEPDLKQYCKQRQMSISNIIDFGSPIAPFYADFSNWDGSPIFTVEGTSHFLITEGLANALKKRKLKNIDIRELAFCN